MTMGSWKPSDRRYQSMQYRRCGRSGLQLPAISLGLWHNFGGVDNVANGRRMILRAFDLGITHFDLANNYGPPPGSAEQHFGKILKQDLRRYRDELIISSKAGYRMWPGPYGEWGSRKYLIASVDQSLRRLGLEYVDIFYPHRPDPETPLEETMMALDQTRRARQILKSLGTPCLIHQPKFSMFERWVEGGLLAYLGKAGIGCIAFSPLAQGMLTDKYLKGIPPGSRASKAHGFLRPHQITEEKIAVVRKLNDMARERNQTLAQMALAWILRHPQMTSVLIGASRVSQIEEGVAVLDNFAFAPEEIKRIDTILAGS